MDKKELLEFNQMKAGVRRLEKIVGLLLRRVNVLEKQNRSIKAKAHQTGLDVAHINHTVKQSGGPYDPPRNGRF